MGATKNSFLELRAEQMEVMYDHEFTKKKAEATGYELANKIFDDGLVDPLKVMSNVARLEVVIKSAMEAFRSRLSLSKADTWNGVTFTPKNGAEKLVYEEDDVCKTLMEKLEARKALVKLATKTKDGSIYDGEGCEVPKVSSKFDKSSITISF